MDRKRLARWATGLFLIVGVLLVGRTCNAENADITLIFERGEGPAIEHLAVAIVRADEVVARYERRPAANATGELGRWKLDLDPGQYTLELELTIDGATQRKTRRIKAVARGTVRLDLSRD